MECSNSFSSTKSVELKGLVRQWRNRGNVCKEQSGYVVSDRQSARPTTRDRAETAEFLRARQACAVSGKANSTDLVSSCSREGDEAEKPKGVLKLVKSGHSKSECRYFSAVKEKRLVQRDKAYRHTASDPEVAIKSFWDKEGQASRATSQSEMSASFTKMTTIKVRTRAHHPRSTEAVTIWKI